MSGVSGTFGVTESTFRQGLRQTTGIKNFNLTDGINIESSIIIRRNASTKSKEGCPLRNRNHYERMRFSLSKSFGFEGWKQLKDAGRRWIANSFLFSIGRRPVFKEIQCQKLQAGLKVMLYNRFMSL